MTLLTMWRLAASIIIFVLHAASNTMSGQWTWPFDFGCPLNGFWLQLSLEAASGGEERAAWMESRVQKSKCVLVTELKLALPLAFYTHPFALVLSLSLAEWLSLSFSVTRSPQPIKCGELVVNFSPTTHKHTKQLSLVGLWFCCYYSSHVSSVFLILSFSPFTC